MKRRDFWKSMLAAASVVPPATAQEVARKSAGLPPLKITDVKVITTSGGRVVAPDPHAILQRVARVVAADGEAAGLPDHGLW